MAGSSETVPDARRSYAEWVESLKQMDDAAWDILLRNYADELRQDIQISLRKRDLPLALVDDIEQETWLTAVRKMNDFVWEDEEKFYHWLRAISLNHIRTYRRVQQRVDSIDDFDKGGEDDSLEHFFDTYAIVQMSVEDDVILREQLSALDQAMRVLKPREREILMRRLMGETPRQLAQDYQIKPRSISMILLRAKEKIEANLGTLESLRNKDNPDG